MPDSLPPEDEIARLRVEKDQGASFGPGCRPDGSSPQAVSPSTGASIPRAWLVSNGEPSDDLRYRMWSGRAWVWTPSLAQAAHFARQRDAEQILPDGDEHGQRIVLIKTDEVRS